MIIRYFATVWAERWLSYGLFDQLEIINIIVYLIVSWNRYNIQYKYKYKKEKNDTKLKEIKAPYGLLGGKWRT